MHAAETYEDFINSFLNVRPTTHNGFPIIDVEFRVVETKESFFTKVKRVLFNI